MPGIEETEKLTATEPHEEQKLAVEEDDGDRKPEVREGDDPAPQPLKVVKIVGNG